MCSGAEGREGPWRFCASPSRAQESGISQATGPDSPCSSEVQSQGDPWLILLDPPSAVGLLPPAAAAGWAFPCLDYYSRILRLFFSESQKP